MIVECIKYILKLMGGINFVNNKVDYIKDKIIIINKIESEVDCLFRKIVVELFKNEKNVLEVIKWKEIY